MIEIAKLVDKWRRFTGKYLLLMFVVSMLLLVSYCWNMRTKNYQVFRPRPVDPWPQVHNLNKLRETIQVPVGGQFSYFHNHLGHKFK